MDGWMGPREGEGGRERSYGWVEGGSKGWIDRMDRWMDGLRKGGMEG